MSKTVKFWSKNVDDGKFAPFQYVGSMGVMEEALFQERLIRLAESIGGPLHGPIICQVEGEVDIWVLRV